MLMMFSPITKTINCCNIGAPLKRSFGNDNILIEIDIVPYMYWIGNMDKNVSKARLIIAPPKSSNYLWPEL